LDALARNAAFQFGSGGAKALQQVLRQMDPLEQLLILSKVSEYLGGGDTPAHEDLETSVQRLTEKHGDEIVALKNSAMAFGKLRDVETDQSPSNDPVSGLRSVYLDAGRTPGDSVISPQKLAQSLLEMCDESRFEVALEQLAAGVLADLRSSQPSRHALRVGVALTNAGAFMAVRAALGIAKELRGRLASAGKSLEASDPAVACKLLQESSGGCSTFKALCNAIFGNSASAPVIGSTPILSAIRHVVESIPNSWWPADNNGAKFKLLAEIDSLLSGLGDSARNLSADVASLQREKLANVNSAGGRAT
jgi:hypothetical protein